MKPTGNAAAETRLPRGKGDSAGKVNVLSLIRTLASFAAMISATYQIYFLPALGTFFPVSLLSSLSAAPFIKPRIEDRWLLFFAFLYWLTIVASGLWSSDIGGWANTVLYSPLFLIGYFVARSYDAKTDLIATMLFTFLLVALSNALLVIVFRLEPALKMAFIDSGAMNIFKNPKLVANAELYRWNVFDPTKSGGAAFDNANTGSAFNLLCIGAAVSLLSKKSRLIMVPMIAIFVLAVIASGSKSALMIGISVSLVLSGFWLLRLRGAKFALAMMLVSIVGVLVVSFVAPLLIEGLSDTDFGHQTVETSGFRVALWTLAWSQFPDHWFLGLGIGGWQDVMNKHAEELGLSLFWPPHNSVIASWADAGMVAALAIISIWALLVLSLVETLLRSNLTAPAVGALFALLCVSSMSMGDTFALLGNQNMAFPLGFVVAWGLASKANLIGAGQRSSPISSPRVTF